MSTVIIGVGVLALVEAQTAFIRTNSWTSQAASATYLANEIRELTRNLPKFDPVNGLWLDTSGGGSTLRGWGPNAGASTVRDFNCIVAFDNLRLASNGTAGFADGDLPGPIDAFGDLIPQINPDGSFQPDANGIPRPMQGWAQEVRVQKVNPFDSSITYPPAQVLAATPGNGFKGLAVDQFPVRVTVVVKYRGPFDSQEATMATVSWVVP